MAVDRNRPERQGGEFMIQDRDHISDPRKWAAAVGSPNNHKAAADSMAATIITAAASRAAIKDAAAGGHSH